MDASLVIPTRNRSEKLAALLESILIQVDTLRKRYSIEVIIVDDRSDEHHKKSIRSFLEKHPGRILKYYELEKNVGAGGARNYGVKQSYGAIILFLDDDSLPEKDYLLNIILEHERHPEIMILNGYLMKMRNDLYSNYWANNYEAVFNYNDAELCEVRMISSGNFSIKRKVLQVFDPLFDESLVTREDFDLYLRTQDAGMRVYRSKKPVTYNDCRSNLFAFIKQYEGYAKGEEGLIKNMAKNA